MQNLKRVPMGAFSEIMLKIRELKDGESIIFNDPKREKEIYERKKSGNYYLAEKSVLGGHK